MVVNKKTGQPVRLADSTVSLALNRLALITYQLHFPASWTQPSSSLPSFLISFLHASYSYSQSYQGAATYQLELIALSTLVTTSHPGLASPQTLPFTMIIIYIYR